jgi:hypothetical protein
MPNFLKQFFDKSKLKTSNQSPETIKKTPETTSSLKLRYSKPREETLAGGFIYTYPLFSNGIWSFALNILKASHYSISMKLDTDTQEELWRQVFERETKFTMEDLNARLNEITITNKIQDRNLTQGKMFKKVDESIPRTEILADGFIYEYPYIKDGGRVLPDNIRKAVRFYLTAKTDQERKARTLLFSQVSEREAQLAVDAIKERINQQIAKEK